MHSSQGHMELPAGYSHMGRQALGAVPAGKKWQGRQDLTGKIFQWWRADGKNTKILQG